LSTRNFPKARRKSFPKMQKAWKRLIKREQLAK